MLSYVCFDKHGAKYGYDDGKFCYDKDIINLHEVG